MRESKTKLAEILDSLLLFAVLTAALFLLLRTRTGALDSLAGALAASVSLLCLLDLRAGKTRRLSARKKRAEGWLTQLTYAGAAFRQQYFAKLLSRFTPVEREKDYLVIKGKRVYIEFSPQPLSAADVAAVFESCLAGGSKAVIITPQPPDKAAEAFLTAAGRIKVLTGDKLSALLEDDPPSLPEPAPKKQRRSLKKLLSAAIDRSLFRRYLFAALLLLGTSYILPSSILYIFFGCLCLAMSVVCLLNFKSSSGRKREKTEA